MNQRGRQPVSAGEADHAAETGVGYGRLPVRDSAGAAENDLAERWHIAGDLSVFFRWRLQDVIAHAQVQSEIGMDFEIVLHEGAGVGVENVIPGRADAAGGSVQQAE